jgi:hypothetical protein
MRKLNPEHPNNPEITTFNSPESTPTTQLSSPPEQTTRVTFVNSLPATTPIAPNTYRRGRPKGSKNKKPVTNLLQSSTSIPISAEKSSIQILVI